MEIQLTLFEWITACGEEAQVARPRYEVYIHSYSWKEKKKLKLACFGYHCKFCGRRDHLEVHHKTYLHFGNEQLDELEVGCRWCHRGIHLSIDDWSCGQMTFTLFKPTWR
jgi:hypothetical protein